MSKRDLSLYFSDGMRYTPLRLAVFDFLLLNISFFIVNYTKQGSFDIPVGYDMLLFLFYVCWLVSGLVGKKFLPSRYQGLRAGSGVLLKSILYLIYLIVFSVVIFGLSRYSRVQVFATCILFFGLEILLLFVLSRHVSSVKDVDLEADMDQEVTALQKSTFSYRFLGLDLLLLVGAFFIVNFMKRGHLTLLPSYEFLLLTLIGLWFGVSLSTRKFNLIGQKNLYFAIWQWIKSGFLIMAVTGVLVFGLRMFQYSRFHGFGTIVLLMGLELLALLVYFSARKEKRTDSDIESVDQVRLGEILITPPALVAAKAALYIVTKEAGLSKTALALKLGVSEAVGRRLLNPRYQTKIINIDKALAAMGKRMVIGIA